MILALTALTPLDQHRQFTCSLDDLEAVFDLLHRIVSRGDTLLKVQLADKNGKIDLSPELLAETGPENPIRALKQQWEAILAQPPASLPSGKQFAQEMMDRVTAVHQARITCQTQTLNQMLELLEYTEMVLQDGPYKARLVKHYQLTIERCQQSLMRLQSSSIALRSASHSL
ncbi:hypothetical protein [Spirosoma koreense]